MAAIIAATLGATGARAQSAQNITATGLVSGLSVLPNTNVGIADLNANLATALAINNGATPDQQRRAIIDNTITSSNGVALADAFGSRLGAIYRAASPTSAIDPGPATIGPTSQSSFSPNVLQLIRQANAVSGSDSAFAKNYLANGTVSGSLTTYVGPQYLPTGGVFGAYDRIYDPPVGANTVGNARPGQVRLDQTASFTQPNFFGVPANNTTDILPTVRTNAAYPSGHTTFAQTTAILFAQLVPKRFQEAVARGSEYGNSRVVLAVHYPMDVIAGRILATYDLVQLLNNNPQYLNYAVSSSLTTTSDFQALFNAARSDLTGLFTSQCGTTIAVCAASGAPDRFADKAKTKADYTYRLTYGFAPVGPTDLAPVVPVGAEILLATRFPYLTAAQRRDVLATTEIASGRPLDDGSGYARLNLFTAADGYGAFNDAVTVTMDAAQGGVSALDSFNNDIGGRGSLTKA
ncbi:phosphatase PAP2 family protein, partial [Methylobacterium sp. 37f]|uniref:phosphatase PAP2 family protein n=1 Tax=Methylobacterium sp. 37f TaxID=2817058 RepID=UPI001FFD0024|nr:phosphatase PAP2 family protein [Methylobacterium sp. 37f]